MTSLAAQFRVKPEELEEKTAEMINACAYFTGGAQWPGKEVKIDFFNMHCVNCSIFFSAFLGQEWMRVEDKVRLLEWKGRLDVAMYASRGSPELRLEEVTGYKAKREWSWEEIVKQVDRIEDDGHVAKLIRALRNGEEQCKKFEGREGFPIKGEMWLQLGRMTLDSVQGLNDDSRKWVRNAGFEKAWEKIPDRARL
jgi:Questin oxidase-like